MPRSGPRKVRKYSDEFKLMAIRLSQQPGMQVQTVAAALEIHPFMLSKWRNDLRDGRLRGRTPKALPSGPAREIAQLQALESENVSSGFCLCPKGCRHQADRKEEQREADSQSVTST